MCREGRTGREARSAELAQTESQRRSFKIARIVTSFIHVVYARDSINEGEWNDSREKSTDIRYTELTRLARDKLRDCTSNAFFWLVRDSGDVSYRTRCERCCAIYPQCYFHRGYFRASYTLFKQ